MSVDVKNVTRACDFSGRAYKGYLQATLSLSDSVPLKKYDQAMLVLRHERRFPATPASLVQQVGQRVFVFSRMAGQLDYNGLVFFHAGGEMQIC